MVMAKKLKRKRTMKPKEDIRDYMKGDRLFDHLRSYYIATGEINMDKWASIVQMDKEYMRILKEKQINNDSKYSVAISIFICLLVSQDTGNHCAILQYQVKVPAYIFRKMRANSNTISTIYLANTVCACIGIFILQK